MLLLQRVPCRSPQMLLTLEEREGFEKVCISEVGKSAYEVVKIQRPEEQA